MLRKRTRTRFRAFPGLSEAAFVALLAFNCQSKKSGHEGGADTAGTSNSAGRASRAGSNSRDADGGSAGTDGTVARGGSSAAGTQSSSPDAGAAGADEASAGGGDPSNTSGGNHTGGAASGNTAGSTNTAGGNTAGGTGAAGGGSTTLGSYTVSDLGAGRCTSINASGDVLGTDESGNTFVIANSGARTALAAFADGATIGVALADNGDVVGYNEGKNGRTALQYSNGTWHSLAPLSGVWSASVGLGSHGEVAGVSGNGAPSAMRAFVYAAGALVTLPFAPNQNSAAYGILADGSVIGVFETTQKQTHAFVLTGGALRDLGTLGGANSAPYGANSAGDIVGYAETGDGTRHGFIVPRASRQMLDLGVPFGALRSDARGVDNAGRVVGNAYDAHGLPHPFVSIPNQSTLELTASDLNGNSFVAAYVAGVNANGQIVGWGSFGTSGTSPVHCLLWTPGATP